MNERYKVKTSPIAVLQILYLQNFTQDYYKVNLRLILYSKIKINHAQQRVTSTALVQTRKVITLTTVSLRFQLFLINIALHCLRSAIEKFQFFKVYSLTFRKFITILNNKQGKGVAKWEAVSFLKFATKPGIKST